MNATLVCEIVGFDQTREVKPIYAEDGVNILRLDPQEPGPATLTLQLPTGGTFKVQLDNAAFEQHVEPLMDRAVERFLENVRAAGYEVPEHWTLRFASDANGSSPAAPPEETAGRAL